jgi:hypothetical protein
MMPIVQPLCQAPVCGLPNALTELAGERGNTGPEARRSRKRKDNCTPGEWQQLLAKRRDQMRRYRAQSGAKERRRQYTKEYNSRPEVRERRNSAISKTKRKEADKRYREGVRAKRVLELQALTKDIPVHLPLKFLLPQRAFEMTANYSGLPRHAAECLANMSATAPACLPCVLCLK